MITQMETGKRMGEVGRMKLQTAIRAISAMVALTALLCANEAAAQCGPGQTSCDGNYCIPSGDVCCGYGNGIYCDDAYPVCCGASSGTCGATSADCNGGSSGGGNCPPGQKSCDGNYCIPSGDVCCGYGSGTHCDGTYPVCCGAGSGTCGATTSDCSGGSSTGSSSSSGGGPGPGSYGEYYCSSAFDISSDCPDLQACCSTSDCYYEVEGRKFYCDGAYCSSAAEDVVDYCEEEFGGCAVAEPGPIGTSSGALAAVFALMLGLRMRRRRMY